MTTFDQEFIERRGSRDGRHRFTLSFRTVSVEGMAARLEQAGFSVSAVLGDYDGGPWDSRADVWLILATRPDEGRALELERCHRLSRRQLMETVMNVMVDVCVVPIGVGVSFSTYVAACERDLRRAGLTTRLHAYGTNIEGEWDEVFAAVKRCHQVLHEMGAPARVDGHQGRHADRQGPESRRQGEERRGQAAWTPLEPSAARLLCRKRLC